MLLGSAHKATKLLKLQACRVGVMHGVRPTRHAARLRYCRWFKDFVKISEFWTRLFSDEAWFNFNGYVNSQNSLLCSYGFPHGHSEMPLHPANVGVWCAVDK
jgi:hypothetical protein